MIVEVGTGVTDLRVGQRVAWPFVPGSYAELAVVPAARAVPVPESMSAVQAAALIAQGLTAHFLTHDAYPVRPGDDVLVHAGAGGVGRLVVQLAAARGARVIATTSSPHKEAVVREAGAADVVIGYERVAERVLELTDGKGAEGVFDGVGAASFEASLASVARRGHVILFGAASGPVPPFDLYRLHGLGSPYLARPSLSDYVPTRADLLARAAAVFEQAAVGELSVTITGRYPLAEAALAQTAIGDRSSVGKLVLLPTGPAEDDGIRQDRA